MASDTLSNPVFGEKERQEIELLLSNPLALPAVFKQWLIRYLETHPPALLETDLIGKRALNVEVFDTIPSDPWNGRFVRYQNAQMATDGQMWWLVYNANSASSYKWEVMGGTPLYSEVTDQETTTSSSYAALATAGPSIAVPLPGDYYVEIGAWCRPADEDDWNQFMSYDIGATGAVDANALHVATLNASSTRASFPTSKKRRKDGLTAVTLTSKYKVTDTTGGEEAPPAAGAAGTWKDRWMSVMPIRVSA